MTAPIEALLRRQRTVTIAALAVLTLLAWGWLWSGAGMGMAPRADFAFAPKTGGMAGMADMAMDMPGMAMDPPATWSPGRIALVFSMWWVMMLAMMLPAAAPVILLHATVSRKALPDEPVATAPFLGGYLAAWGAFSLAAALAQVGLETSGALAPVTMAPERRWLAVGLLVAAGLYQLSPLKDACLAKCRDPATFLSRHLRPGATGAFKAGAIHGAVCVGCCWLLMALLFVGGVMNLAWIALLTLLVAAEKQLPGGRWIARGAGVLLLAWGAATAVA